MHSRSIPARENRALDRRIMRQGMEMEVIVMVVVQVTGVGYMIVV